MKKMMLVLSIISFSISAGEFTGAGAVVESVLKRNNLSMDSLKRDGFKVLLGEVTGAGKSVPLDALKFIVTKKELMPMSEVTHINFKNPSAAKSLSDIKMLEFHQKRISIGKVKGVIFR